MKNIKTTTKYNIIFVIVSLVMGFRCIGVEEFLSSVSDSVSMAVYVLLYILWGLLIIRKTPADKIYNIFILLIFFTIWAMSIFTGADYIGSTNTLALLCMLYEVYFIIIDANIVFLVLCPLIGVLARSEFLFAYMGLIIVLLIYNAIYKNKTRYIAAIIINLCTNIGTYLFFTFSSANRIPELIGLEDDYIGFPDISISLLRTGIMCVLLIPYIVFYVILIKKMKRAEGAFYRILPFGAISIVPLFFMINNYGTWFFAIVAYYSLSTMALILMNDQKVDGAFSGIINTIRSNYKYLVLLLIYAVLFTPIDNVKIGYFVNNFIR